jgi:hypothetical protein
MLRPCSRWYQVGVLVVAACLASAACGSAASTSSPTSPSSSAAAPAGSDLPRAGSVTYVGNSGFLIWVGEKKVLVDALFEGLSGYSVPAAVRDPLLAGRAPFDNIDLILATHSHGDHFGAASVRQCLQNNPRATFVGPADTVAQLAGVGNRAIALDVPAGQRQSLSVNGVAIVAMPLSHGTPPAGDPGIVNLGYVFTVGNVKFFHTGDIDASIVSAATLQGLGVPDERIDVAFVQHFLLSIPGPIPLITQGIGARYVVASHLQYTGSAPDWTKILQVFPTAILLKTEMENWTIR